MDRSAQWRSGSDVLRPLPGDLILLARVIAVEPARKRQAKARQLLEETAQADGFRRTSGTLHPEFGDGSLIARLMREVLPPLTHGDDPDLLDAIQVVARAVLQHTAP